MERDKALRKIDELSSKLKPPAGFVQKDNYRSVNFNRVVVSQKYVSSSSCEEAEKHYGVLLSHEGWDVSNTVHFEVQGGLGTLDVDYRNGPYLVNVSCEKTDDDGAQKQFVVTISWGLR